MPGPLEGVRVLDLTAVVSGPLCTQVLADQGAEVIKVEPPGIGDLIRIAGPMRGGLSAPFTIVNRGKRSLVVNLREPRAVDLLLDLVPRVDVFAQNFRPGAIERMGLGYDELRALNPDLIYLSISGFGPDGPYAEKRVYDPVIQTLSGMAAVQKDPSSGEPDLIRNIVCDKVTALTAAQAVVAALFARERGAGGQLLRLSMLDSAIGFLWPDAMPNETFLGDDAPPAGPTLSDIYRITRTADGFMTWIALSDAEFHGVCRALGRDDWSADPRFATLMARAQNGVELIAELEEEFQKRTTGELLSALAAEDVPCAPVNLVSAVADDPQVIHNATLAEVEHPHAGRLRQPRPAARFEETPAEIGRGAPLLGEHTAEILAELGIADEELSELVAAGVVAVA